MFGAILGAVAPMLVGGLLQRDADNRTLASNREAAALNRQQAKEDAANKFVDLRKAAVKGGFNPLTGLMATGGSGFGNYGGAGVGGNFAPLASVSAIQGAISGVSDIVTGDAALRRQSVIVSNDLMKAQAESLRHDAAGIQTPTAGVMRPSPRRTYTQRASPVVPRPAVIRTPQGPVMPDGWVPPERANVVQEYSTTSGETVPVPTGPDFDEVVTGIGIEGVGIAKRAVRDIADGVRPYMDKAVDFSTKLDEQFFRWGRTTKPTLLAPINVPMRNPIVTPFLERFE